MNRNLIAILGAIAGIAAALAGFYIAFFAAAARIPPGRELGMIGAALGIACVLACVAIGFVANRWAQRRSDNK
jgi:ABC-type antimicrobial peptide transport system permease subunit